MKISYNWLQQYIEEKLPEPEVLADKIIFGAFEVEDREQLENGDTTFEIKVLPDRAHDCLSHYGIAKEISGLLGLTLKPFLFKTYENVESDIRVTLETGLCRRYIARKIFDVKVKASPAWLAERMESIGQRSINNVVDATNYVMYTLGQPIHAFDYDKVAGAHLVVRPAHEGELLTTLDSKDLVLTPNELVIADDEKALAIAGVKGGKAAEVTADTTSIILEVANFDPVAVRKTARKLNILTDSAKRFENELTPHLAGIAIHMITDLIIEVAGGQPCFPLDEYPNPVAQNTVTFSTDLINTTLGTDIGFSEIGDILTRYGYEFEEEAELFKVLVPFERIDITGAHDMCEEVGRAYGYEKIPARIPVIDFKPAGDDLFSKIAAVKNDLASRGYQEVYTYSLAAKGDFEVARGPVGKSALRKNLSDGLAKAYELNKQNGDLIGVDEMKIFEVGTVFPKSGEELHVAFADKKGIHEMNSEDYLKGVSSPFQGEVAEGRRGVRGPEGFVMWSEYPYMTRDIAVWIPESEDSSELVSIIKENGTELLAKEPRLFDQFSKDGKTSYAYRMVFQSYSRTLTDEEVTRIMDVITEKVKAKGWEVR